MTETSITALSETRASEFPALLVKPPTDYRIRESPLLLWQTDLRACDLIQNTELMSAEHILLTTAPLI